ncbi:MAG: ThiF family adenylyltransferase [Spirosomataceae bacterium]
MEKERYSRQTAIPTFGNSGQQALHESRVLVIGAGGLGSPVLLYLAAAGVGTLGIVESDQVDLSNLQRQILYTTSDVGQDKLTQTTQRLLDLNPTIQVRPFPTRFTSANAMEIASEFDLVVDASDNLPTRYLVNDTCHLLGIPWIYGAIYRFEGQVAVFNHQKGIDYRDLFPSPPPPELTPNCATAGVLGVMAGLIGTLQATEAVKVLTGLGTPLDGELLLVDTLTQDFRKLKIPAEPNRPDIHSLIDYEAFCGLSTPEITWNQYQNSSSAYFLLDVRETWEHEEEHIGGFSIPLDELEERLAEIPTEKPVLVHCLGGTRSAQAVQILKNRRPHQTFLSLQNGLRGVPEEAFIR